MIDRRREKLKIVFELNCESGTDEVEIGPIKFSQFVLIRSITAAHALCLIVSIMRQLGMPMEFKENGEGKSIPVESYLKHVEKSERWSIPVEAGGLLFQFGNVCSLNHSFVIIEEINAGAAVSWEHWIQPFLAEASFLQAWVADVEYDYWQNARDPIEYEAAGRSYAHLPTKSNGLPPPLTQTEIDTSNNPGRWCLKSGYIEAIGSTMWFSKSFWALVGDASRNALLSAKWLDVQFLGDGITKIISAEHCFCDVSTKDIQDKLRAALYDEIGR